MEGKWVNKSLKYSYITNLRSRMQTVSVKGTSRCEQWGQCSATRLSWHCLRHYGGGGDAVSPVNTTFSSWLTALQISSIMADTLSSNFCSLCGFSFDRFSSEKQNKRTSLASPVVEESGKWSSNWHIIRLCLSMLYLVKCTHSISLLISALLVSLSY